MEGSKFVNGLHKKPHQTSSYQKRIFMRQKYIHCCSSVESKIEINLAQKICFKKQINEMHMVVRCLHCRYMHIAKQCIYMEQKLEEHDGNSPYTCFEKRWGGKPSVYVYFPIITQCTRDWKNHVLQKEMLEFVCKAHFNHFYDRVRRYNYNDMYN